MNSFAFYFFLYVSYKFVEQVEQVEQASKYAAFKTLKRWNRGGTRWNIQILGGIMTYSERNKKILEPINQLIDELRAEHDKYTSSSKVMTDEEWEAYIPKMRSISDKRKGTNIERLAEYMSQYFLDDTEYVQKELKKIEKSRTNKTA
jgi:hypothetical protein